MKKTSSGKILISPADACNNITLKRDVSSIIKKLNNQLDKEKPVEQHVYQVLMQSECGMKSSVGQHLNYKFNYQIAIALLLTMTIVNPNYMIPQQYLSIMIN